MCLTVGIHQPNFLPWLGWFDKLDRSDKFIVLDAVQLERQSATTRVAILHNRRQTSLTVPVRHVGDFVSVREAEIDHRSPFLRKMPSTLRQAYGKTPFWRAYGEPILDILGQRHERLIDLNMQLIRFLADALTIDWRKVCFQSNLEWRGKKSELVASLTRAVGGNVYLSGGRDPAFATNKGLTGTAADYNEPSVFASYGVKLEYQNFVHPVYEQRCTCFFPGLSAIDALFRLGPETLSYVRLVNTQRKDSVSPELHGGRL